MAKTKAVTIQTHLDGAWHNAAVVNVRDTSKGTSSPTSLSYDTSYYFAHGHKDFQAGHPVIDRRAVSVCCQIDLDGTQFKTWPSFLLDLLPQGYMKQRLLAEMGFDPKGKQNADFELLLRSAGAPIGNLRVKEAWTAEQDRLHGKQIRGVSTEEIFTGSEAFLDMADRFALLASGSSGVQGDWPKILLALARDGLWYPDSTVSDDQAQEHIIVKMLQAKFPEDALMLEAEAPYLEVARSFGIRVGKPHEYRNGRLIIHRFDRQVVREKVLRLGQESLVAATGVAEFGYVTTHENYIATLHRCCSDPKTEIIEYVLRDVLNRASGDTDNHGRNTALQKRPDGWIGLTPRFDFVPMQLHPSQIRPSTTWACWRDRSSEFPYHLVCEAVGEVTGDQHISDDLREALLAKADTVAELPAIARRHAVPEQALASAFRFAEQTAADMNKLRRPAKFSGTRGDL